MHESHGKTPHSSFYGETPPHVPHAKYGQSESDAALQELISHIEAVSSPAVHQEPEATNVQEQQPSAKSEEHVPNSDSKKSVRFSLRRGFNTSKSDPAKSCLKKTTPPTIFTPAQDSNNVSNSKDSNKSKDSKRKKSKDYKNENNKSFSFPTSAGDEDLESGELSPNKQAKWLPGNHGQKVPEGYKRVEPSTKLMRAVDTKFVYIPPALQRLHVKMHKEVELYKWHVKHAHASPASFWRRTNMLGFPQSIYDLYSQMYKNCETCKTKAPGPPRAKVSCLRATLS